MFGANSSAFGTSGFGTNHLVEMHLPTNLIHSQQAQQTLGLVGLEPSRIQEPVVMHHLNNLDLEGLEPRVMHHLN